jgi:hypothetical protein
MNTAITSSSANTTTLVIVSCATDELSIHEY